MSKGWKLIKKKRVYFQRWVKVEAWHMQLPRGGGRTFYINKAIDFVMVCAVTKDNRVVIPRQYYISQLKKIPTLVAGYIDKNEKPQKAAARELLEETGFAAKRFIALGTSSKGKYMTGVVHHFLGLDAERVAEQHLEEAEDITVSTVPLSVFKKMVAKHTLADAYAEVCGWRSLYYLENSK